MGDVISRENFKTMPAENQMQTLYDLQVCTFRTVKILSEHCPVQKDDCEKRFSEIEKGSVKDRRKELAVAGLFGTASGVISSIATVVSYLKWWSPK